jgi:hypothetical protein
MMSDKKGTLKAVVGRVTGDRHVEAEGVAEVEVANTPGEVDVTDDLVAEKEIDVRKQHSDVPDEGLPPATGPTT